MEDNKLIFNGEEYELIETPFTTFTYKSDGYYNLNYIKTEEGLALSSPYQHYKSLEINGKYYRFEIKPRETVTIYPNYESLPLQNT